MIKKNNNDEKKSENPLDYNDNNDSNKIIHIMQNDLTISKIISVYDYLVIIHI